MVDPMYLWSVLRSSAVIAEWLAHSTGVGRHRVEWNLLREQSVPLLPFAEQKAVGDLYRKAARLAQEGADVMVEATGGIATLDLDSEMARDQLARAKPPR